MKNGIGRLISILHRHSQIYINHALKEFGITSAEYIFLLYLYREDGLTQEEISSYISIDKAATARAIQSLKEKGYVIKAKDDMDKRCNRVFLTEKAKNNENEIRRRVWRWSDFLTEGIDEETTDTVLKALEQMAYKAEQANLKTGLENI